MCNNFYLSISCDILLFSDISLGLGHLVLAPAIDNNILWNIRHCGSKCKYFHFVTFSREDLVFKQAFGKRAESSQGLIKLSLQSVTLSPGQCYSVFITRAWSLRYPDFRLNCLADLILFGWFWAQLFILLALWDYQNFCLRFLFKKYFLQ